MSPPFRESDRIPLESRIIGDSRLSAFLSYSTIDAGWDTFLQSTPLGHFQQSAIWAQVKAAEGWKPIRVIVHRDDAIAGGFQILMRRRGPFHEGLLNKGPVCPDFTTPQIHWMLDLLEGVVRREHIQLLVTQAPDLDTTISPLLDSRRHSPNVLAKLITATLLVRLTPELPPIETRFRKTIRVEIRQAKARGVAIRAGTPEDLPVFFDMMRTTCKRQHTTPNPPTLESLQQLWHAFDRAGRVRLTIAECDGVVTAGMLALKFGRRLTLWKKGWTEAFRDRHPNTLLTVESIKWAQSAGFETVDFVGGERSLAQSFASRKDLSEAQRKSRYFFLLGFGPEPMLLPLARVFIPNLLARTLYGIAVGVLRIGRRVES